MTAALSEQVEFALFIMDAINNDNTDMLENAEQLVGGFTTDNLRYRRADKKTGSYLVESAKRGAMRCLDVLLTKLERSKDKGCPLKSGFIVEAPMEAVRFAHNHPNKFLNNEDIADALLNNKPSYERQFQIVHYLHSEKAPISEWQSGDLAPLLGSHSVFEAITEESRDNDELLSLFIKHATCDLFTPLSCLISFGIKHTTAYEALRDRLNNSDDDFTLEFGDGLQYVIKGPDNSDAFRLCCQYILNTKKMARYQHVWLRYGIHSRRYILLPAIEKVIGKEKMLSLSPHTGNKLIEIANRVLSEPRNDNQDQSHALQLLESLAIRRISHDCNIDLNNDCPQKILATYDSTVSKPRGLRSMILRVLIKRYTLAEYMPYVNDSRLIEILMQHGIAPMDMLPYVSGDEQKQFILDNMASSF